MVKLFRTQRTDRKGVWKCKYLGFDDQKHKYLQVIFWCLNINL